MTFTPIYETILAAYVVARAYVWLLAFVAIVLVVVVAVFARMIYEAKRPIVRSERLFLPQLDPRLEGTRLVFAADIHAGPSLATKGMTRLVNLINALKPDVLLLGGDYVGGHMRGNEFFYGAMGGVRPTYGSYAVVGNHDYWETPDIRTRMHECGIALLRNENAPLEINGARMWFAGIDDMWEGEPDLVATMNGIDESEFAVLISHNPDFFADGVPGQEAGFDLALAGHTHGGQITAFGMAAMAPTSHGSRYLKGWRVEGGIPILVTTGIGSVMLPLRFHARPEIHLIELARGELGVSAL